MSRSFASRLWYESVRNACRLIGLVMFRARCSGREYLPKSGGYLLLSNHQSHLDPPLVGMMIPGQINYLARETLFSNKWFGGLIRSLDAIPIDREGLGLAGLKETLRRLKRGEVVLLFPEGTRSPDGKLQPLKPGFSALATRAGVPIVPCAIAGAFEAFPRGAKLPRCGTVRVVIGRPLTVEELKSREDRELVELVGVRIAECFAEAERLRGE